MPRFYYLEEVQDWTIAFGFGLVGSGGGFNMVVKDPDNDDKYRLVFIGGGAGFGVSIFDRKELEGAEIAGHYFNAQRTLLNANLTSIDLNKVTILPWDGYSDLSIGDISSSVIVKQASAELGGIVGVSYFTFVQGFSRTAATKGLMSGGVGLVGAKATVGAFNCVYFKQIG